MSSFFCFVLFYFRLPSKSFHRGLRAATSPSIRRIFVPIEDHTLRSSISSSSHETHPEEEEEGEDDEEEEEEKKKISRTINRPLYFGASQTHSSESSSSQRP